MGLATRALLYHFTHIDNLPAILAAGALVSDAQAPAVGLRTEVGDLNIKARRRGRRVPCGPGGTIANYVPFYFAPRSPMMYRIVRDAEEPSRGRYSGGDDPLVYLVTSVDRVKAARLVWVAADGNCATPVTRLTDDFYELDDLIDWPLMQAERWNNTEEDPDRKRRRAAEFLVYDRFPLSALAGFAVRTPERVQQVGALLTDHDQPQHYISVRGDWYYGPRPGGEQG